MRNSVHDDEHLLTTEHQVECCERAHIMANRVQYSRGYFYFYGLLIALNVFLLAWVFVEADYPLSHAVKFWVFVLLDGAVTLCILIEVVLTALVQRRTFLRLWSNRFDLFVLALCFAAIGMHALGTVNTEELELEELDVFDKQRRVATGEIQTNSKVWTSKYAPGGSARLESAQKLYVVVDSLLGHFASNGLAPLPDTMKAKARSDMATARIFLDKGK